MKCLSLLALLLALTSCQNPSRPLPLDSLVDRYFIADGGLTSYGANLIGLYRRVSGQVQFAFDALASSIGHIRAGRLRALGVGNATRVEALPDVPSVAEFLLGYEASGWIGLGAPRNTPAEIIDKLNREINAGLAD